MVFPDQSALVGTLGSDLAVQPTESDRAKIALDFVADLRRDFEQRDKIYELIDQVTFLEQKVEIPENYKATAIEVRSPLPRHIANQITASMSINSPVVHMDPIKFGDDGENEAAHRCRFFEASFMRQQREKKRRIFRIFMDSVVVKGDGWLKTMERKNRAWAKYTPYSQELLKQLDKQVADGTLDGDSRTRLWDAQTEEFKRRLPYPIETTEVPPECMYYQYGEDGFVRIAEVSAVPYYETLKKYGKALNGKGQVVALDDIASLPVPEHEWASVFQKNRVDRKTLELIQLWDPEWCTILLRGPGDLPNNGMKNAGSGCFIKAWRHGYGDANLGVLRGPYFHSAGILTSSREPHKATISVLYAYLHLFPLLNALLTMQSQAAFSFAYPAFRRTTPPTFGMPDSPFGASAADITQNREKIVPGAIFPHDIAPMDMPHTSVDLDKAIQFVKAMIDLALPDTVQGAVTGEMAGYTLNQAAHLATLTWGPIVQNVQDCLSDRVGWESMLIDEYIGETVYVSGMVPKRGSSAAMGPVDLKRGWLGLGPKDIDGYHIYEVTLDPATINDDQLQLRVIRDELDMRLMSPNEAVRRRGRNPVEVERDWLLYELKQDPEIRNHMKQRIFQQLGTMDQQQLQALPPGAEPGGQPPIEMSGMPPGAQPGVSQGLPTTGFVPPAGSVPAAPPPGTQPGAPVPPAPPGPTPGSPGGIRGVPQQHEPLPGGG